MKHLIQHLSLAVGVSAMLFIGCAAPGDGDTPAGKDNADAWGTLSGFTKPFLLTFSDSDPISEGGDVVFRAKVPGSNKQNHITIQSAGHFLHEDKGPELAEIINEFIANT